MPRARYVNPTTGSPRSVSQCQTTRAMLPVSATGANSAAAARLSWSRRQLKPCPFRADFTFTSSKREERTHSSPIQGKNRSYTALMRIRARSRVFCPRINPEIAPWVSHPSAKPLHLSNATYFYTNFNRHRNQWLRSLPAVEKIAPARLRFAWRLGGSPSHDPTAPYKDDPVRKTVF